MALTFGFKLNLNRRCSVEPSFKPELISTQHRSEARFNIQVKLWIKTFV